MTDSLGNAFAPKAPGITITQFQSFKLSCRGAAGGSAAA